MAVKTITITVEAYDRLASLKGPKDSFSDVILENYRYHGRSPLWDLVGIMSKERADELEKNIMENRRKSSEYMKKRAREIADALNASHQ